MKIAFDKELYAESAVRQALKDYAAIAEIEMNSNDDNWVCSIISSEYAIERTALEFSNYVLNLSVMSEKDT